MRRPDPWVLVPGLALVVGMALVAAERPDAARLRDVVLFGVLDLLLWGVALAVRQRYPERPLWRLMMVLATLHIVQGFVASPNPWLFTLARAARPVVEVLLIWIMVAFPTGQLGGRRERALVWSAAAAVLGLWLPGLMFSPHIPLPGPFVSCRVACPENLLFIADWPDGSAFLLGTFRSVGVVILAATSVHLFLRLRHATPLMRRSVAPVLLASIGRLLAIAHFLATGGGDLAMNLSFPAVPLAIAWGLLRGRLYTARVLQQLVSGLVRRPAPAELRDVMSVALGDPTLQLGYRDADGRHWLTASGQAITLPPPDDPDRAVCLVRDARQRPAAVLVHDRALLDEPLLRDALVVSLRGAMLSHQVELARQRAAPAVATAVERERRRIERDLHDGAQQRLLALRLKLGVSRRLVGDDPGRACSLLEEMDADIAATLREVRELAHGLVPPVLAERGLAAAVQALAQRASLPVTVVAQSLGRLDPAVERAIYFCCAEALQNATKHAGGGAQVRVSLIAAPAGVEFVIEDDGPGLPGGANPLPGSGFGNMRDRLDSLGGSLDWGVSAPLGGLRLHGRIPLVG